MSKPNPFIAGDSVKRISEHGLLAAGNTYKVIDIDGAFVMVNTDVGVGRNIPVRAHHSGFEAHPVAGTIKAVGEALGIEKSEVQKVLEDAAIFGTGISMLDAGGVRTHIPHNDFFKKPTIKAGAYVDVIPEGTWKSPAELMEKADTPSDAVSSTLDERGKRYGDFTDHAKIAQNLQHAMRTSVKAHPEHGLPVNGWDLLTDVQKQALTVIADKIARILNGDPNYADNWHDIQGYAKLVEDRLK